MELTVSFVGLLDQFAPVFTAPTFVTFVEVVSGWLLSHRHRYVTEVIFASGNVGNGHWCRYHRFFSHAAWDLDVLSMHLAKLVATLLAPGAVKLWAVDDTLCRKRGMTLFGAGMHHDPLISSRAKPLVSWGHDWVVLCLLLVHPFWAPTKVFALPVAFRLYRNRQGIPKGKKSKTKAATTAANPDHRTRPQLAVELLQLVSQWFADDELVVCGDSAYGGKSVLQELPANVHLISHVHPKGVLYAPAAPRLPGQKGPAKKKGARLPGMAAWANDANQPWTELPFDQFGLHASLAVKSIQALYYTSGRDRLLTVVLTRDLEGKRPDSMFYCTNLTWSVRQILSAYACRWAIECAFENCKQLLGLEDPANRLPQAVRRTAPMAMIGAVLAMVWFHQFGHRKVRFPVRPWYRKKREPSFADILTTLRRESYREKSRGLLKNPCRMKTWLGQITELLSRAG